VLRELFISPVFIRTLGFQGFQHCAMTGPEIGHRGKDQVCLADAIRLTNRMTECCAHPLESGVVAVHAGSPEHADG
jgi:hypothetical protein